ncbi:MAG: glycerophosphoryl diester phosphodiesterase membrane domain-containing protein [archaeon]|jgi:hypothetical protein
MNYKKLVNSAYSWISLDKAIWYLLFFCISVPVLLLVPMAFEQGVYSSITMPLAIVLYDILYISVILGLVVLIQFFLEQRDSTISKMTIKKLFDLVFLVFVEIFYVLIWNLNSSFRLIQALLLIATALVFYYSTVIVNEATLTLAWLCLSAYFIIVIYNSVRVIFSTTIFCHKEVEIKEAVKESWALTEHRFYEVFSSLALLVVLSFIFASFVVIAFGTLASLILSHFFIDSVAMSFGFKLATAFALGPALIVYHCAFVELFLQLSSKKELGSRVKRILAHKVLRKGKLTKSKEPVRKFAKKKVSKKRK